MPITTATILATGPCAAWTTHDPGRIARALAALDCSSWSALVESAAARGWVDVSIADARLTLCRAMTPAMRVASVKRSTFIRVDAQIDRCPDADDDVAKPRGAFGDEDPGDILGTFKAGYKIHAYQEWLIHNVQKLIAEDLRIGSVGLLKGGAVAWVQVEMPDTMTTAEGVS